MFRQEMERQFAALPKELSALVTFDYFYNQGKAKRKEIENAAKNRDRPFALTLDKTQRKQFAVLSFFTEPTDLLLWRYYGNNHRYALLEIDVQEAGYCGGRFERHPQISGFVRYQDERPISGRGKNSRAAFFTKPKCCANECEWRVVRPARQLINMKSTVSYLGSIFPLRL